MKQEWRVKEKVDAPAPTTSNDDMFLLDDDEAPLIKDGSLPSTGMDINMVFMMPVEFRGIEEEVAQMYLSPKDAVFEKPEVRPALEAIVHSRAHRWEANILDAHRWQRCHQLDGVFHLQEGWKGG
jgi:hypothetical protein